MIALTLTIAGTDRSIHYVDGSLSINLQANEASSGTVKLRSRIAAADLGYEVPAYRPLEGELVTIAFDGEDLWTGEITQIKSQIIAPKWIDGAQQLSPVFHYLTLTGLEARLAKRIVGGASDGLPGLVLETSGTSFFSGGVVSQLLSDYGATGISAGTIEDGYEIDRINYGLNGGTSTWRAISNQAKADGYIAWIDATGKLHYRRRGFDTAVFAISPARSNYRNASLTTDRKQYTTRLHQRINYKAFAPTIDTIQGGEGDGRTITTSQPIARVETIHRVNGPNRVEQSFGPSGIQVVGASVPLEWVYDVGSNTITMNADSPALVELETVEVSYRGVGSDVVTTDVQPGITEIPIETYKEDFTVTSVAEAQQAGLSQVQQAMVSVSTLQLETDTSVEPLITAIGPGRVLPVDIPDLGARGSFIVNSVGITDERGARLLYSIQAVSGQPADAGEEGADESGTQPYAETYEANPSTGAQATGAFGSTDSASAPPVKDSGASRLYSYLSTGAGIGTPNEIDVGHPAEGDTEYTVFGIGIGEPATVEDDVTPRRTIYSNGNPYECWTNCKSGSGTIDIKYNGTSIFAETPIVSTSVTLHTVFADGMFFERGGLLRCDVLDSADLTDAHILLRWKYLTGPAGDTGSDDGDTEGVPTTL